MKSDGWPCYILLGGWTERPSRSTGYRVKLKALPSVSDTPMVFYCQPQPAQIPYRYRPQPLVTVWRWKGRRNPARSAPAPFLQAGTKMEERSDQSACCTFNPFKLFKLLNRPLMYEVARPKASSPANPLALYLNQNCCYVPLNPMNLQVECVFLMVTSRERLQHRHPAMGSIVGERRSETVHMVLPCLGWMVLNE